MSALYSGVTVLYRGATLLYHWIGVLYNDMKVIYCGVTVLYSGVAPLYSEVTVQVNKFVGKPNCVIVGIHGKFRAILKCHFAQPRLFLVYI